MVSHRITTYHDDNGNIDLAMWLDYIAPHYSADERTLIENSFRLTEEWSGNALTFTQQTCLQAGLMIADKLVLLKSDAISLATAPVYILAQYTSHTADELAEHLDSKIIALLKSLRKLDSMRLLQNMKHNHSQSQIEHVRKMLIAMADDARAVLIKLAERTHTLQTAVTLSQETQKILAEETRDIYAPLANRLGIWQLKWQLEDQALRYLEPEIYKSIAKSLKAKRTERDQYIQEAIQAVTDGIKKVGIKHFEVAGRAKHIYSIARKMARKNVDYKEIYDASAIRVLVGSVNECYAVLGIVHGLWNHIPEEFDDYVVNPKPNGYSSLHTAVVGPHGHNLEVQIRTYEMHAESELGVAAHWAYKEGQASGASKIDKMNWLRQVLDWQREVTHDVPEAYSSIEESVYVFTPTGDIVDLPAKATPLDFAYQIHTQIGHRCRGAKVNGNIVPLTYQLETGQQVEILTQKTPRPSRDWASPQAGYLASQKARNKVIHWFKQYDQEEYLASGQNILEKELRRISVTWADIDAVAKKLNLQSSKALLIALGAGDIKVGAVKSLLTREETHPETETDPELVQKELLTNENEQLTIAGIDNVLNHIAKCCKPLPGEKVVGFITQGRGVTIHLAHCKNVIALKKQYPERLVNVNWTEKNSGKYLADLHVIAQENNGLFKDISTVVANEKLNLAFFQKNMDKQKSRAFLQLTIEVPGKEECEKVLEKIRQLPMVIQANRA